MSDNVKTVDQFLATAKAETGDVWMDNHDWKHLIEMVERLRAELDNYKAVHVEAVTEYDAIIKRLQGELQQARAWIAVSERLPEPSSFVLCVNAGRVYEGVLLAGSWYSSGKIVGLLGVTHWRPLPEPPQEANG